MCRLVEKQPEKKFRHLQRAAGQRKLGTGGVRQLLLQESFDDDERVEMATALVWHQNEQQRTRWSERESHKGERCTDRSEPWEIGAALRRLEKLLPSESELPAGLQEDLAVVSNSSALLGSQLGPRIDGHRCVARFNEFRRAGSMHSQDVGSTTTIHVCSELVSREYLSAGPSDDSFRALDTTPLTLWLPPLSWGHASFYSRYARLLLDAETDGLDLTLQARRRIVLLRYMTDVAHSKYLASAKRGTTGFRFVMFTLGLQQPPTLFGFEDDPRNLNDPHGGHYFNPRHEQVPTYDFKWERLQLQNFATQKRVRLISCRQGTFEAVVESQPHVSSGGNVGEDEEEEEEEGALGDLFS
ncbi:hypothetical protein CYMTET_32993 [Cymbomonas tetramitiformis]|uniref:Uncharacterized protein n=1 Tax=Cymbomonas tetramitiformis TaxID=36881 RepID=A0AAE0FE74_9CHLO|nr:hypothetical protein CYMTET_32993 [Cymbomonas tetramitiformis]